MLSHNYYAQDYTGIIGLGLPTVLLPLYLEIVLTENYGAVKLMVDG